MITSSRATNPSAGGISWKRYQALTRLKPPRRNMTPNTARARMMLAAARPRMICHARDCEACLGGVGGAKMSTVSYLGVSGLARTRQIHSESYTVAAAGALHAGEFRYTEFPRPRLMATGERMPKARPASAVRMWITVKSIDITFHALSTRNILAVYARSGAAVVYYVQTATKQFPPIPFRETPRLPQARRLTFSHSAPDVVNLDCRRSCQGSRLFYRVGPRSPAGQLRI